MIHLTDNAVAAIKTALSRAAERTVADAPSAEGLRIMVQTGGCAGFKYMMGLEAQTRDGDEVVQQDGVTLFIDRESQPHLAGMTVDFVTGLESSGFVFENPNAVIEVLLRQVLLLTRQSRRRTMLDSALVRTSGP